MLNRKLVAAVIFAAGCLALSASSATAQSTSTPSPDPSAAQTSAAPAKPEIPPFHAAAPKGPLPTTLDPHQFPEIENQNLYALAAKEKAMLYQEPCFCHCNREVGHESLLDCFVDSHAANCMLCKKEAVLTYNESRQGKTAAQIRQDIIDGKWKTIDLSKYDNEIVVTENPQANPTAK
jgi:Protein of unknown function with PCYCGC motif